MKTPEGLGDEMLPTYKGIMIEPLQGGVGVFGDGNRGFLLRWVG